MCLTSEEKERIKKLAIALSLLDSEVRWSRNTTEAEASPLKLAWKPLSDQYLNDLRSYCDAELPEDTFSCIAGFLNGSEEPSECVLGKKTSPPESLHHFLKNALRHAIAITQGPDGKNTHGAIYLHNWQSNELVMAACQGFPLRFCDGMKPDWYKRFSKWLDDRRSQDTDSATAYDELHRNVARLRRIHKVLRPLYGHSLVARDEWLRDELRAYPTKSEKDLTVQDRKDLDCNKDLIGIAYYKADASGITARLFDPQAGPELERPGFDEGFRKDYGDRVKDYTLREPLKNHLEFEKLRRRTIAYEKRGDMAAGRSVKAGVYEGLQFPCSAFIGPFLGTVLRFRGEHLGILKVEKHQFETPGKKEEAGEIPGQQRPANADHERPGTSSNDPYAAWKSKEPMRFGGKETFDFLLFAYVLSGILYLLRYHGGRDLTEGWTTAP